MLHIYYEQHNVCDWIIYLQTYFCTNWRNLKLFRHGCLCSMRCLRGTLDNWSFVWIGMTNATAHWNPLFADKYIANGLRNSDSTFSKKGRPTNERLMQICKPLHILIIHWMKKVLQLLTTHQRLTDAHSYKIPLWMISWIKQESAKQETCCLQNK